MERPLYSNCCRLGVGNPNTFEYNSSILISLGSVYYYEAQEDFFDENKTCTGEIPVVAIHTVESVYESKIKNGCGFAIQARVVEGGDTNGFRTYVFEAKTPDIARQWMEQICKATGLFS